MTSPVKKYYSILHKVAQVRNARTDRILKVVSFLRTCSTKRHWQSKTYNQGVNHICWPVKDLEDRRSLVKATTCWILLKVPLALFGTIAHSMILFLFPGLPNFHDIFTSGLVRCPLNDKFFFNPNIPEKF